MARRWSETVLRLVAMSMPVKSPNRWIQRVRSLWKVDLAVLVGVLVLVVGILALQVRDHPQLSLIDELQHFDYTLKSPSAGVRIGELYGTEAMKVVACRGIDVHGWEAGTPYLPVCGDSHPDRSAGLYHSGGDVLRRIALQSATRRVGERAGRRRPWARRIDCRTRDSAKSLSLPAWR